MHPCAALFRSCLRRDGRPTHAASASRCAAASSETPCCPPAPPHAPELLGRCAACACCHTPVALKRCTRAVLPRAPVAALAGCTRPSLCSAAVAGCGGAAGGEEPGHQGGRVLAHQRERYHRTACSPAACMQHARTCLCRRKLPAAGRPPRCRLLLVPRCRRFLCRSTAACCAALPASRPSVCCSPVPGLCSVVCPAACLRCHPCGPLATAPTA